MPESAAHPRPLVLVLSDVDDGTLHVSLLRLALMQRGYAVILVHSPDSVATMIRERDVDVLLVALALPEASRVLRELGEARPRVAITFAPATPAAPAEHDTRAAHAAGFDIALERPVDFADLDATLREHLGRRTSGTRAKVRVRRRAKVS